MDDNAVVISDHELNGGAEGTSDQDAIVLDEDSGKQLPKGAVLRDDGRVQLTLRTPVTMKFKSAEGKTREETFSEITMRRLVGADLLAAESSGDRKIAMLFARSAGISPQKGIALFERMTVTDITAAAEVLSFFV